MMKYILSVLAVCLLLGTAQAQTTISDENVQLRDLKGFTKVNVSGGIRVLLSQSAEETVGVSCSKSEFTNDIKTEVKNGTLYIYFKPARFTTAMRNIALRAYVSFKNLSDLDLSGACNATITDNWKADKIRIDLSGASNFKGNVDVGELRISQSGASDITVSGKAGDVKMDLSGASDFKGFALETQNCSIDASGASKIKVTVQKEFSIHASGASDVKYKGSAVIRDVRTSGASSLKKVN